MSILPFRTSTYARNIYMFGVQRLTPRDGYTGVPEEYVDPVETYAKQHYTLEDIQYALEQGWINQEEYDATILK